MLRIVRMRQAAPHEWGARRQPQPQNPTASRLPLPDNAGTGRQGLQGACISFSLDGLSFHRAPRQWAAHGRVDRVSRVSAPFRWDFSAAILSNARHRCRPIHCGPPGRVLNLRNTLDSEVRPRSRTVHDNPLINRGFFMQLSRTAYRTAGLSPNPAILRNGCGRYT